MALLFLLLGIFSLGISAWFYTKKGSTKEAWIAESVSQKEDDNLSINKQKGNEFEDYMIQLLGKQPDVILFGKVSDYHKDGVSARENRDPDLRFKMRDVPFSVECKWRKSFYNEHLFWAANYQIQNYKNYQKVRGENVFVAIGVGGTPSLPAQLFIIPLDYLKTESIGEADIKKFEVRDRSRIQEFLKGL